jgi:hypothetical protein
VDDSNARLECTVEQLRLALQSLQQRVEALEAGLAATTVAARDGVASPSADASPGRAARARRDPYDPIVILTLIGRLFLVLAGGFFLRAMTEAGLLAPPVGIGVAFLYALLWLFLADRSSRQGQSSSSLFHALGAALVAFPLLIEATTRFQVIGVAGSTVGLFVVTAAILLVAARRRLHAVAWITVLAALPTSVVLLLKTGFAPGFVLYLIALGLATLWLAYVHAWTLIRWPVALVADVAVAGMAVRAFASGQPGAVRVAILLQLALVGAYLAGIAVRTLLRDRNVTVFEVAQTVLALAIGFGGAIFLTRSLETAPALMGAASLAAGVACYVLAFRFVGRHEGHARNVYFYATLALVLVLAGLALELPGAWLGAVCAALAVLAAAAWPRYGRSDALLHAVAYLVVAGVASGALSYGAWAIVSSPERWTLPDAAVIVVVAAALLSARMAARRPHPEGGLPVNGMRLMVVVVLVWAGSGLATGCVAPLAATAADGRVDLGALATVRTGVLAAVTLLVAWGARRPRLREWGWLVYPLLVFIGLKMVAQDFNHSRPATLFIALASYGIALIVAPRLRRTSPATRPVAAGHSEPA